MPTIAGHIRLRSGSDAARQAATLHAREPHYTGADRTELWIGERLVGRVGYHAFAPNPADTDYTVSTFCDFDPGDRAHFARVAPQTYSADYTHTVILPASVSKMPRNGDAAELLIALPVSAAHTITIKVCNAASSGTELLSLAASATVARKWNAHFRVTGGAWELTGIAELLTE